MKGVAWPDLLVFLLALKHVQHTIKSGEELLEGGTQAAQRLVHHRSLLVAEDQLLAKDGQELVTNVCYKNILAVNNISQLLNMICFVKS